MTAFNSTCSFHSYLFATKKKMSFFQLRDCWSLTLTYCTLDMLCSPCFKCWRNPDSSNFHLIRFCDLGVMMGKGFTSISGIVPSTFWTLLMSFLLLHLYVSVSPCLVLCLSRSEERSQLLWSSWKLTSKCYDWHTNALSCNWDICVYVFAPSLCSTVDYLFL